MGQVARRGLTPDEFYAWLESQPDARFELVDGEPVLQAGAMRRHDRIVMNAARVVGNGLLGKRCQPFSADTYIRIPGGNRRMPDLGVDCGPMDDTSVEAAEPVLVVEILSPSTRSFDLQDKVEEYKSVDSIAYILLIDPDVPQARLHTRADDGVWSSERIAGIDGIVRMPGLELRLGLAELYAGLEFEPRPALAL